MQEIIDAAKSVSQLGVDGVLAILVYLLWREVRQQKAIIIECLQSGGKLSEKTLDEISD